MNNQKMPISPDFVIENDDSQLKLRSKVEEIIKNIQNSKNDNNNQDNNNKDIENMGL